LENRGIWRIEGFGDRGEIVEVEDSSKTRSEKRIIRSLRTCVQNHEARSLFLGSLRHLWENPFLRV
jgi:hypothetical protein